MNGEDVKTLALDHIILLTTHPCFTYYKDFAVMATSNDNVTRAYYSSLSGSIIDTGQEYTLDNVTTEVNQSTVTPETYNALLTITVPLIMFACGVFGNVLALAVLGTSRKKHRKTVFYRLVGALACTDLFGIVSVSPITILVYSKGRSWIGGEHLCHYFSFMMIFSGIATLLIVGAMALERFVAIIHPYAYETRFSIGKVKYIVMGIWGSSIIIAAMPIMGLGENVLQYPGTWCFFDFASQKLTNKIFTYFYASIGLLVIIVTALCNVAVMIVLVKMRQAAKDIKPSIVLNRQNSKLDSEVQMMILLGGIILVFATCYAPLMVRLIINQSATEQVNHPADLWAIRMACINQILDPWVYILFRKELFVRIWEILHCKFRANDKPMTQSTWKRDFKRVASSAPETKTLCETKQEHSSRRLHFLKDLQCCSPFTKRYLRKGSGKSLLIPMASYGELGQNKKQPSTSDGGREDNVKNDLYFEGDKKTIIQRNIPPSVSYP